MSKTLISNIQKMARSIESGKHDTIISALLALPKNAGGGKIRTIIEDMGLNLSNPEVKQFHRDGKITETTQQARAMLLDFAALVAGENA